MTRPMVVDLFSGVGGLSLGFEQAGLPVSLAVDVEFLNVMAYKRNFPYSMAVCGDLSTISARELLLHTGLDIGGIDVVIGGPPCQGFSMIGSRRVDDPRNRLIFDFLRLCAELQTQYFVMENVPGLKMGRMEGIFSRWLIEAESLGYEVVQPLWELNASNFGVPQSRTRCFAIGYRRGLPVPRHPGDDMSCGSECQLQMTPTVGDAIDDLPDPRRFVRLLHSDRVQAQLSEPSTYARYLRGESRDPCDLSEDRLHNSQELTGSKRTVHTAKSRRRFKRTEPGSTEPISRFPKLDPHSVSPTLRAGTKYRSGGYTAARPIHHYQPRCITVREAARLQSFPDWFEFDATIWHGFRQVGNAVPPNLARAVALSISNSLGNVSLQSPSDRQIIEVTQ